ncbi:MAG TPA: hypothetical protein VNP72_01495 [Longimicrobium sp.]|nr:hypothetical protein [Longimicrobium sp.]
MAELPKLNALQLRTLTEHAASLRGPGGALSYMVRTHDDGIALIPAETTLVPENAVIELDTADQQAARPSVITATMVAKGADGRTATADLMKYDAVFWSEAAVEKFVLPYYASKSMWMAAHVLSTISRLWYGFVPGEGGTVVQTDEIPFAMAHIPSSDYVGLDVGDELHLLFRTKDGQVDARPLSRYL